MTQPNPNPTRAALTGLTDPSRLSGRGTANLSALANLTGLFALDAARLSALTGPGDADLTEPNTTSTADEHGRVRLGPSLGGLPGGSPVRETPSEPPPAQHPTVHVNADVRPIRDRGD